MPQFPFPILSTFLWALPKATFTINIQGISPQEHGNLYICLWESDEGFPNRPENATFLGVVDHYTSTANYEFSGVPYGSYAISIHQNEQKKEAEVQCPRTAEDPMDPFGQNPAFIKNSIVLDQPTQSVSIKIVANQ